MVGMSALQWGTSHWSSDTVKKPGQCALLYLTRLAQLLILTHSVHTKGWRSNGTCSEKEALGRSGQQFLCDWHPCWSQKRLWRANPRPNFSTGKIEDQQIICKSETSCIPSFTVLSSFYRQQWPVRHLILLSGYWVAGLRVGLYRQIGRHPGFHSSHFPSQNSKIHK